MTEEDLYRRCPGCKRLEHKDEPTCRVCGANLLRATEWPEGEQTERGEGER